MAGQRGEGSGGPREPNPPVVPEVPLVRDLSPRHGVGKRIEDMVDPGSSKSNDNTSLSRDIETSGEEGTSRSSDDDASNNEEEEDVDVDIIGGSPPLLPRGGQASTSSRARDEPSKSSQAKKKVINKNSSQAKKKVVNKKNLKEEDHVVEARPGHENDLDFRLSALRVPKPEVQNQVWADNFYKSVFTEEARNENLHKSVRFRAPGPGDRAHDDERGMTIYWKSPKSGFRLPLTHFQRKLLKHLDVAPSQLADTAWCQITSFEYFFETYFEMLGRDRPTLGLFFYYFSALYINRGHLTIRKRPSNKKHKTPELFDMERSKAARKIDQWDMGWVYLENPDALESLRGIRITWRPLKLGKDLLPNSPTELSPSDKTVIANIDEFLAS